MSFPPEVFLIGAQKSGTTSLAFWLDQHPRITLSEPKEPHFFTVNFRRGLGWYHRLFKGPAENIFIDASSSYTMAPIDSDETAHRPNNPLSGVPERIYELNPKAKFIYVMRNPVSRTYSAYWHSVRAGEENRPFHIAIRKDSIYLRSSDYCHQIEQYLHYFPITSFLFLCFEELTNDPIGVTQECFRFLNTEPLDFTINVGDAKNQSYTYTGIGHMFRHLLSTKTRLESASKLAKTIIPDHLHLWIGRVMTRSIPDMSAGDREFLTHYFREKNEALQQLTGLNIKHWQDAGIPPTRAERKSINAS